MVVEKKVAEDIITSSLTPLVRGDGHPQSHLHVTYDGINHAHPWKNNCNSAAEGETDINNKSTYWSLMTENSNFRWYLLSYLVTLAGEWMTYIASISAIEHTHSSNGALSRTSISFLVILRLLPSALFASIGGVLADSYDRRKILFILDVVGAAIAWLFILSYYCGSIYGLYVATLLQMTVAAIYEPSRTAILPMLVFEEDGLKKAMTISGLAWSVMQAIGSVMGGLLTQFVGIPMCFAFDSLSYLVSALFIWEIRGRYNPVELDEGTISDDVEEPKIVATNDDDESKLSLANFTSMTKEGLTYLCSQPWGAFVMLKFCAAFIYGPGDILNVAFSEHKENNALDMEDSSQRLGILFAFVGIGAFLGPVIAEPLSCMDNVSSLERACLVSFLFMALGFFGMSQIDEFIWICIATSVRTSGSSVVWIYSSLLLQKLSSTSMLGRVVAVDYALAMLSESVSALLGGVLQDDAGMSAAQVSLIMAIVSLITLLIWGIYFSRV
jgi:MFS family permease